MKSKFILRNTILLKRILRLLNFKIFNKISSFPIQIQIQTINLCNGSCVMCPRSITNNNDYHVISDSLFEKIINEIVHESKSLSVILMLQNEPLMDDALFKRIQFINKLRKKISVELITNGNLFTNNKIKELEKSDVNELVISLDAYNKKTYNKIRKGLNFKTVLKNIDKIIKSDYRGYFFIGFVKQKKNYKEINEFKKYWKKKGVVCKITNLCNRSGDLNNYEELCLNDDNESLIEMAKYKVIRTINKCCPYPINWFNILSNGDVILCCNDYSKKVVLGNLNNSTIKEIWNNKQYSKIRELHNSGDYDKIPVCKNCSL